MDSIIVLLLVLVPIAFRLIGSRLENAGNEENVMGEGPSMSEEIPDAEEIATEEEEAVRALPPKPSQPSKPSKSSKKKTKAFAVTEETKPQKKDPIDPKKLVICSEIMKPKF
jgi:hypothetical protein